MSLLSFKRLRFRQFFLVLRLVNLFVEAIVDENTNSLKKNTKKGGAKLGGRKALNDITNKSSLSHDVSSKKNNVPKEEFNVAEERFLHDHRKCVEAQQMVLDSSLLDIVLPGRGKL